MMNETEKEKLDKEINRSELTLRLEEMGQAVRRIKLEQLRLKQKNEEYEKSIIETTEAMKEVKDSLNSIDKPKEEEV